MSDEFDELLKSIATDVFETVRYQALNDRVYEKSMSQELTDRMIAHEAHKKIFDERRGKYRFIDLYFPDNGRFAMLKSRKYITRTEINELKEDEQIMGSVGMIINFYNGVIIRYTNGKTVGVSDIDPITSLPGPGDQNRKSRMTLPHLTASTGRLNELPEPSFRPHKLSLNGISKSPMSVLPLNGESSNNTNRIFSLSCAAFFLSEGDRKEFSTIFNELLTSMKFDKIVIPEQFLTGPKMSTPDGELLDVIKRSFNYRRKSKKDKDHHSDRSSKAQSPDEHEQEIHYIGFNKE